MEQKESVTGTTTASEPDYIEFEKKLLSPSTSVSELEAICMTLAHLPSKEAQHLLGKFKKSARGPEVGWLDVAMDEGQFVYLEPRNETEERDYLALKMIQEMGEELVELDIEMKEARLDLDKMEIEHRAIRELIENNKIDVVEGAAQQDIQLIFESRLEKLRYEFELKEKIIDQIQQSITTPRYKNLDPGVMRDIHFI